MPKPIYYKLLPENDCEHLSLSSGDNKDRKRSRGYAGSLSPWAKAFVLLACAASVTLFWTALSSNSSTLSQRRCESPAIRREWRELLPSQRLEYIDAVRCLTKAPSILSSKGSIYDDFALVHKNVGSRSIEAAFDSALRYQRRLANVGSTSVGAIPAMASYWDWNLDWKHLQASPVFDAVLGFGGNGALDSSTPGRCVTDGPFKDVTLSHEGGESEQPHCLTRFFRHYEHNSTGHISGVHVNDAAMRLVYQSPSYDAFSNATGSILHNAIHWGIGGDFETEASANDPLFYLHHAQLDRIWWQWQQESLGRREEYYGASNFETGQRVSVEDLLSFDSLWKDVSIKQVMRTDGGILCYTYPELRAELRGPDQNGTESSI